MDKKLTDEKAPQAMDPELRALMLRFRAKGMKLVVALCVIIAAVVLFNLFAANRQRIQDRAVEEFSVATEVDDYSRLMPRVQASPLEPLALLSLAKREYERGDFGSARASYEDFLARFDGHELLPVAILGRWHAIEAEGRTSEAVDGFAGFVKDWPGHFLSPQARLGHARCLEAQQQPLDALRIYEELAAAYPDTVWEATATSKVDDIKRRIGSS